MHVHVSEHGYMHGHMHEQMCAGKHEFPVLEFLSTCLEAVFKRNGLRKVLELHPITRGGIKGSQSSRNSYKLIRGTSRLRLSPPTTLCFFYALPQLISDSPDLVQVSSACVTHFARCGPGRHAGVGGEVLSLPPGPQP